jgi:hypothetical protein
MFLTCLIGILLAGAAAALFAAITLGLALQGEAGLAVPLWTFAGFCAVAAILCVPAYLSGRSLFLVEPPRRMRPSSLWLVPLGAYPMFLALGAVGTRVGWFAPVLSTIALLGTSILPVAAIVWLIRRRGPPSTGLRAWGHFTIGLTWMPGAALAAEVVALLPVLVGLGIWLTATPDGASLLQMMRDLSPSDPQAAEALLLSILESPAALVAVYGYVGLAVPVIEEVAKTMAVWPYLRRRITSAEAFLGGALGGAGYALFEALFLTQPGEDWAVTTIARAGASLLHIFTAGLTSWGLVSAIQQRRWRVLALAYLASTGLHAAWNASALTVGLASIPVGATPSTPDGLALVSLTGMAALSLASLAGIWVAWDRLRGGPGSPGPTGSESSG